MHKEDQLIDCSIRACGILVIATNCQVVISFEEILRAESRKQVLQALANIYTIVPSLPRVVIYDAGCLLVKYLRSNYENETAKRTMIRTNGLRILYEQVRFFVDRFHLTNHREVECSSSLLLLLYCL